eukprot:2450378-Lingulodinium_polyedra.AAC.1
MTGLAIASDCPCARVCCSVLDSRGLCIVSRRRRALCSKCRSGLLPKRARVACQVTRRFTVQAS